MARARRLTRAEKICVSRAGFDPTAYWCIDVVGDVMQLVHKRTGKRLCVSK